MRYQKVLIVATIIFLAAGICFAENLAKQEALGYYNEGVKYQQTGDLEKAYIAYNKVLILDASYAKWIYNNYGLMYVRQGNVMAAEVAFKKALEIDPNYKQAKINLAYLYERTDRSNDARLIWEDILHINELINSNKPQDFILEGPKDKEALTEK